MMEWCEGCQKWCLWLQQPENVMSGTWADLIIHETPDSFLAAVKLGCRMCKYIRKWELKRVTDQQLIELQALSTVPATPFATMKIFSNRNALLSGDLEPFELRYETATRPLSLEKYHPSTTIFSPERASSIFSRTDRATTRPDVYQDLQFLSSRLASCKNGHEKCNARSGPGYVPTRLLFVGTAQDPQLRLYLSREEPSVSIEPYITLSHRWGGQLQFKLQDDNLEAFRNRVEETKLPKTFRDAVYVARYFGIRFIWIDAMCVIQDNTADWELESAQMSQIFENAHFTTAASHSNDSFGGLFTSCPGLDPEMIVQVWQPGGELQPFILYDTNFFTRLAVKEPLYRRGWVVQEQFLSARVLHFTTTQVVWECRNSFECQSFPAGLPQAMWPEFKLGCGGTELQTSKKPNTTSHTLWRQIIGYYSACELTFSSDKLAAIQGLVAHFQREKIRGDFLDGVWVDDLTGDLLWMARGVGQNYASPRYRAPSWSWASMDGPIDFYHTDNHGVVLAEVRGYSKMILPRDTSKDPTPGWIKLRGTLLELHLHHDASRVDVQCSAHIAQWPSLGVIEKEIRNFMNKEGLEQSAVIERCSEILIDLCTSAARLNVLFDTKDLVEQFAHATATTFSPVWLLPLRFRADGLSIGLLVQRVKSAAEDTYSRVGTASVWCDEMEEYEKGMRGDKWISRNIMARFLRGELSFQLEQPQIFGKRTIKLV